MSTKISIFEEKFVEETRHLTEERWSSVQRINKQAGTRALVWEAGKT